MTTNSISAIKPASFTGLATYTYNIPATGRYKVDVSSTIPWQASDSPSSLANLPAQEKQDITLVADSTGSLNSTYFTFYTAGDLTGYYVWYNINAAGTDPMVSGLTGIEVAGATNASAATLATATRVAIAAVSGIRVTVTGATSHVILTDKNIGSCTAAANGAATPGFSYSITKTGSYGKCSGLNVYVKLQGSTIYTLSYPSPTQPSQSGSVISNMAADDVVTVVTASTAPVDQLVNAVKTIVNIFLLRG